MPLPERYNTGYNVGVGGAVVQDGKLLLVRRASRRGRGNWQIPGGFIEPDETMEVAVVREVAEEAGVQAEVVGVLGIRSRYNPDSGNSVYVVLLMRPISGEPLPDGKEVDQAGYFTLEEIQAMEQVPPINQEVARRALASDPRLLQPEKVLGPAGVLYTLFIG
jgi:ADP-ribose pyrophosphatase YjhB (NUDIX family)